MDTQAILSLNKQAKYAKHICYNIVIGSLACMSYCANASGVASTNEQDYGALMHSVIFFALIAAGVGLSRRHKASNHPKASTNN